MAMKTLYATSREKWRAWLEKNHDVEKEIWLVHYKKHTGKASIPYNYAVEEAICFGWIDTTVKKLDDERFARKFTPRKSRSKWNKVNIERAEKMIKAGRMTGIGLAKFKERVEYDETVMSLELPSDLEKALKARKSAWKNFNALAPSYRKYAIYYITDAKREETRRRRIRKVVRLAEGNKRPLML